MNRCILIWKDSDHPCLKFLKKGYRHVGVIVSFDGCNYYIDYSSLGFDIYDTCLTWEDIKYRLSKPDIKEEVIVREYSYIPSSLGLRLAPLTCVEVVKTLLGINAPLVLTPYQLYKYLERTKR